MKKTFGVLFLISIVFSVAWAREITFTVLPSGDLKRKSDQESARDLKNFSGGLSQIGSERCSRGVRDAVKAEYGIDIFDSAKPGDLIIYHGCYTATMAGMDNMLKRNGYEVINPSNYIPQKGDIQTIAYLKPIRGRSGLAHAQYFDGNHWISDHVQKDSYANPSFIAQVGLTAKDLIVVVYRRRQ